MKMGWLTGLEPATTGITIRGSTNWATITIVKVLNPRQKLLVAIYADEYTYDKATGLTVELVRPAGLEPATTRLEGGCSIQLSYGRV